eukprot:scaffold12193_cov51-Attheya_sp.AAC.1
MGATVMVRGNHDNDDGGLFGVSQNTNNYVVSTSTADDDSWIFLRKWHGRIIVKTEESVAIDQQFPNAKFVFVSKIVDGGNAEKAGLQPGDVIVGISGTFDDVVPVAGLGLEQVRSLVGGRLDTEPLTLEIVRGTNVLSDHQTALVDLCLMPDEEREVSINQKLSEFLKSGYCDDDDDDDDESTSAEECNPDSDADCLVDSMYQDWHNDFEEDDADFQEQDLEEMDNNNEPPTKPNPAPWSSRSSPSGTFVRDPATGKLRNIDAP